MTSQRPGFSFLGLVLVGLLPACTVLKTPTEIVSAKRVASITPEAYKKKYPLIIAAIIHVESKGNPRAVSRCGAKGLMQLMPKNIKKFQVEHPFDPEENIEAGNQLFEEEMDRFDGDVYLALAAYNAGSPRVIRAMKRARSTNYFRIRRFLPRETIKYVPRVFEFFNKLKSQGIYTYNFFEQGMLEASDI